MRQYKSIILTLLVALFFGLNANAQGSERAVTTKIGDALNMLPADTQKKYNKLMGDIAETGAEGIKMLLGYLNKQDDTRRLAEYAINGYVSFVADPKFDAQKRQIVIDAIKAEYDKINKQLTGDNIKDSQTKPLLVSNKEFLVRQLQFLGVIKAPVEAEEAPADAKTLAKNLKAASKLEPNFANNAARCVAISNYVEGVGVEAGQKTILKALKDDCRQYRLATIYAIDANAASEEAIKPIMDAATKKIAKAKDCVKVDLLYWMGNHPAIANTALITPLLSSANAEVVEAAAWTLARIANPDNIADVAKLLASADADKVALAEKVLKSYKGNVCQPAVAVEGKTAQGETATLNLISARKDASFNALVNEKLNAEDAAVKDAAYKALKDVSTKDNLGSLYALIEKCDAKYVPAVQDYQRKESDCCSKQAEPLLAHRLQDSQQPAASCYLQRPRCKEGQQPPFSSVRGIHEEHLKQLYRCTASLDVPQRNGLRNKRWSEGKSSSGCSQDKYIPRYHLRRSVHRSSRIAAGSSSGCSRTRIG